jgi:hypothetical protein
MPTTHVEGFFWNLPVNPVWRVPGFMKEGKADNEHSNPVLLPLVPEFTNICISHLQLLHFQKFLLEVVAIGRKNAGWESNNGFTITKLPASFRRNSQKKEFVTEEELSEAGLTRADWNWMIHHKG